MKHKRESVAWTGRGFRCANDSSHFSEWPSLLGLGQEGEDVHRCEKSEEKKEAVSQVKEKNTF